MIDKNHAPECQRGRCYCAQDNCRPLAMTAAEIVDQWLTTVPARYHTIIRVHDFVLRGLITDAIQHAVVQTREADAVIAENEEKKELREIGRGEMRYFSGKEMQQRIAAALRAQEPQG